jgi:hypothetical protein
MKQKLFAMCAVAVLLLGMSACSKEDTPAPNNVNVQEQDLVGLWWDEFEYADVTEDNVPFSRVLLAVQANADHTGCIYLGVFNNTSDEPLAVYGGPEDAGFTWRLLANGNIVLGDPVTGEEYALTRSYGNGATDVPNTSLTYNDGSVQMNNGSYSGTLHKANGNLVDEVVKKLATGNALSTSAPGMLVGSDGKAYAASNKDNLPQGVTAAGMVAYKNGFYGIVIALANEPQKMNWYTANGPDGAAKHTPAVMGYTWRVPTQSEFKQIFKATSGAEDNYKNLNDLLAVFGDSCKLPWEDEVGTSTPTTYLGMDEYWFIDLYHDVADYALFHSSKSYACTIRACFAF